MATVTTRAACTELGELTRTLETALVNLRAHLDAGPHAGFDAARCARTIAATADTIAARARAEAVDAQAAD